MDNTIKNVEGIISRSISGFHQYILNEPVHIGYVSENFCMLTGFSQDELLHESKDLYQPLVHAADSHIYAEFIRALKTGEPLCSCEYRLMKKDGSFLYVRDTTSVENRYTYSLVGNSVLTDITKLKNETTNLQFLNETIPCGFLKYTCETQPKVTYVNEKMLEFLRFPETQDAELDYLAMYRENIFLMIPMEERRRFALYLNRVYSAGVPIAGDITVLRCDGTRAHLFGWVTKCVNAQGIEEFQSVCMDITQRHLARQANETKRYLKALTDVYDKIFEYDLSKNTVNCLYANQSPTFKWMENIPMQMEDATEKWICSIVATEDCDTVRAFFKNFYQKKLYAQDAKPPQITYHARTSDGEMRLYNGIVLKMDDARSLFCCRCIPDSQEAEHLRSENLSLKENMQELVLRFTDGIAAFEVTDDLVTPLYASDNLYAFFGLSKAQWLPLMQKSTPLRQFVAHSKTAYENFKYLLQNGEAEFTYFDLKTQTERRIKAICSRKSPLGSAPRYIMLYNLDPPHTSDRKTPSDPSLVSIRTFGYFDVFVGEKPIIFRNKKSKELFALLVDRRGGYVSSEEAIAFLWEDEPVSPVTLSRYRKVALRLKNTLEEYGIQDVVESIDGKRRIVTQKVQCDLYNYLSGKEEYSQLFKGSYLSNYSWGETTLAELTGNLLHS